jgi:hypothetical protein
VVPRQIGEGLDLDRCNFYEFNPTACWSILCRAWSDSPAPSPVAADRSFPWALETLSAGQTLYFERDDIPTRSIARTTDVRHPFCRHVPLSVGGSLGAVVSTC